MELRRSSCPSPMHPTLLVMCLPIEFSSFWTSPMQVPSRIRPVLESRASFSSHLPLNSTLSLLYHISFLAHPSLFCPPHPRHLLRTRSGNCVQLAPFLSSRLHSYHSVN